MSSINAKNVAKEVSESVRKGKKVNLGKIIRKNGYSLQTSLAPQRVTKTISYQEITNPIVQQWNKERQRLTNELASRDLSKEEYRTLLSGIDVVTKNIQLLSGKPTENINFAPDIKQKTDEALEEHLS